MWITCKLTCSHMLNGFAGNIQELCHSISKAQTLFVRPFYHAAFLLLGQFTKAFLLRANESPGLLTLGQITYTPWDQLPVEVKRALPLISTFSPWYIFDKNKQNFTKHKYLSILKKGVRKVSVSAINNRVRLRLCLVKLPSVSPISRMPYHRKPTGK